MNSGKYQLLSPLFGAIVSIDIAYMYMYIRLGSYTESSVRVKAKYNNWIVAIVL